MKQALVTGASEGIGRSFAMKLTTQGFTITAVARNEVRLKNLMNELGGAGHDYLIADLSTEEGIARISHHLSENKYDLLVNNAGFTVYDAFHESKLFDNLNVLRVNCEAVLCLSHAFLLTAKVGDALINVSSTASFLPMTITSVYTGSKAFVTGFTESLWYEERKRGVYVMALCPGMTQSQFHTRAGGDNAQIPSWASETPDQVVELAMRELARRKKPIVVSGPQGYAIFLSRFISRRWLTLIAGKILELGMKNK